MASDKQNIETSQLQELLESRNDSSFRDKLPEYLHAVWKAKWFILFLTMTITLLVFLRARADETLYYRSSIMIIPEFIGMSGGGSGGADFGMRQVTPIVLYEMLVTSEPVLRPVITDKYWSSENQDSVNLIEFFGIVPVGTDEKLISDRQFYAAYGRLTSSLIVIFDRKVGSLSIEVTMSDPIVCADVANNIYFAFDGFLKEERRDLLQTQLEVLEVRKDRLLDSLTAAENSYVTFLERNRIVETPELALEDQRLKRKVDAFSNAYSQVSERVENLRFTLSGESSVSSMLNIKEFARPSLAPLDPGKWGTVQMYMVLSFSFALIAALLFPSIKQFGERTW
ncbi:MAG: hypothetical protein GF419_13465, partial [Ignavibacteriales bacterium]|nr:hypothetical protein [Ignavibacteriales bacterium]